MRRLLILVCFVFSGQAFSQQVMEIIPLRYRMVEQVLPSLQPFVEPGGALSGMNNQLIVRSSGKNIAQIRQALSAIDLPARRLMIYVSQNRDAESRHQGAELSGQVGFGNNVRIIQPSSGTQGNTRIDVRRGDSLRPIAGEVRRHILDHQPDDVRPPRRRVALRLGRSLVALNGGHRLQVG